MGTTTMSRCARRLFVSWLALVYVLACTACASADPAREPERGEHFQVFQGAWFEVRYPYTGEVMVWRLSHGYGSAEPVEPDFEREVFGSLPVDPARRRRLASLLMTGISVSPEQLQALGPEEERELFGPRDAGV